MILHTVDQAINSKLFDRIIVSTNDEAIIKIVKNYPVEILERNENLAKDNFILLDVVRDCLKSCTISLDSIIGLLLVTAPLRSVDDLLNAFKLFF